MKNVHQILKNLLLLTVIKSRGHIFFTQISLDFLYIWSWNWSRKWWRWSLIYWVIVIQLQHHTCCYKWIVYIQGQLSNGQEIVVKRLSRDSGQGDLEFMIFSVLFVVRSLYIMLFSCKYSSPLATPSATFTLSGQSRCLRECSAQ